MNLFTKRCVFAALASQLLFPGAALQADDVDELINTLKPSPLDYAAWAGSLLKAADDLAGRPARPKAQARLYEQAYEYGIKDAKGHPLAMKAARALLKARPDEKLAWQQKLLAVYRLDWQAADRKGKKEAGRAYVEQMIAVADDLAVSDNASQAIGAYTSASRLARYYAADREEEISRKLRDIREQQKLQQLLEQLKGLLAKEPDNTAVRERLILLYVVELDRPGEARKLLTAAVSEELRTCVPSAAGEVEGVAKEVCLELGDWYRSLADGAHVTVRGKARALTRAKAYYERFVKLEADPLKAAIAKAKLAQVVKELAELWAPPGAGDWGVLRSAVLIMTFEKDTFLQKGGKTYVRDLSGNDVHGTVTGATVVSGQAGTALAFDGKRDIVSCLPNAALRMAKDLTLCAWVKGETPQGVSFPRIIDMFHHGKRQGYMLETTRTGGEFGIWGFLKPGKPDGCFAATQVLDGQWHHVAGSYDGETFRVYIDGKAAKEKAASGEFALTGKSLTIGNGFDGSSWFPFKGAIDEVAVFNR
ncbi:MAG: LamG domain-containing protein, partial [Phycisphaerae bacterium]